MAENRATKRLKSCDSEEGATASKRSRHDDDEEEFRPRKLHHGVQQQPCSEPDLGVGSSSEYEGSSSRNKKFEVFISHRGPDTKGTLAYHMYDLLRDRGVEAFLDKEELQSGESFPLAIKEAIACSKVDVCILSSRFAESEWCLKELEMMMEKYEMRKSKLIPIFYDVKPSEVRHLQGDFGQRFQTKIIDKKRYSTQLIDKWRQALYNIGGIKGEEGKGECCMAVVNKILNELDVGLVAVPSNLVGRQKELLSIKHDIMRCRENGCSVMEISGVGGIGKTTFAKQLYNEICPQYKRCCFIEDVGGLVEKFGVKEVHNQLISKLLRYEPRNMRMEGKKLLMDRLHNEEILVVLDNIHGKIPLSAVFIEDDVCLNPRSIIIATSREKAILEHDPRASRYCENLIQLELSYLDYDASKELFCQYAFQGSGNVSNEFNKMIKKFVTKCHGIPLALTVVGSQLYRREIKFWEILWNSIKNSLHPDVQKILKISYNHLDSELQKRLFLDVATFLRWEKKDLLVKLHQSDDEDGESKVLYALDVLQRKNLIEAVNGVLMMHDLLVDLGRSIVRDEDSCPGRRSHVWDPSDVRKMLSHDEMGTKKVKALSLVSQGLAVLDEHGCPWPADAFRKLSSLEFLILHDHCIEGDLSMLSKRLLWLKWTNFPYECIPPALCLKCVKILHVSGENLTRLWEHHPQKEAPTNIRQLSLLDCMNLQRLPKFTRKFRHLTHIDISKCTSLKTIPDSFGQLQALKHFQLQGCESLVRLPETFGGLRSLCYLDMRYCLKIKSLPNSFGKLSRLEGLDLCGCQVLKGLPKSFGHLQQLKYLKFRECLALEHLSKSFGHLPQLKELDIDNCPVLKGLPKSFGHLPRLEVLYIRECPALKRLPKSFGHLPQLEAINLKGCPALKHLPKSFGHLRQLKYLYFIECLALEHLSKSFGHLPQLKELFIRECPILKGLPKSFGHLQQLKNLRFSECLALEHLSKSFGHLPRLERLAINQCPVLKCLPKSFGHLQQLKNLNFSECLALEHLSKSFGHLPQLEELFIRECPVLKGLPKSFGHLRQLKYLFFTECLALEHLSKSFGHLPQLEELFIRECPVLKGLPKSFGHLQQLKTLIFIECLVLEHLSKSFGHLPRLKIFFLDGCPALKSLPKSFGHLQQLNFLDFNKCLALEHLSKSFGHLPRLEVLYIRECPALKRLPKSFGHLPQLKTLYLDQCRPSLKHLPESLGYLLQL